MTHSKSGWHTSYEELAARIGSMARNAPLTFCGLSACTDARVDMRRMDGLLSAEDPTAQRFRDLITGRAARGIGGEVMVDWPEGAEWLGAHVPISYALGGTGPQAAMTLGAAGAPAITALEDRSAHMLARVPGTVLLSEGKDFVPATAVSARGERRPDIFIFEYTAGEPIGSVTPPRSSRIIVRFLDPGLEHDEAFERLTAARASEAGAAVISGFNSTPLDRLEAEYAYTRDLVDAWGAGGLREVHLELAGYDSPELCHRALEALRGRYTSLGMSQSEFRLYFGEGGALPDRMAEIAARFDLDRIAVHADEWAAAVTRGDPAVQEEALMTGCLLAAARAEAGRPVAPTAAPAGATFADPPFVAGGRGDYRFVACASPYLVSPATTLGLGDTFTGGCLLVLGSAAKASETAAMTVSGPRRQPGSRQQQGGTPR